MGIVSGAASPTAAGAVQPRRAHGGRVQYKPRPPHGVMCHTLKTEYGGWCDAPIV